MQRFCFLSFIYILLFAGCGEKADSDKNLNAAKEDTAVKSFFPVSDYIKGRLAELDSSPVTPLKIVTANGKEDSVWMKREDIRLFAAPFVAYEIDSAHLSKYFTSASFLDQTINAFTFSFDPAGQLPDSIPVRRWDVYVDPQKNTIRRIYIVKNMAGKTLQLTWTNDWCKITTINEDLLNIVTEEKMIWNF